uniref:F-box and WD repeat domain containing 8 n=1 Tax=Neolamprologus brichardi TaxID=32507 RepID=A0A3Q4MRV9_NEOBR
MAENDLAAFRERWKRELSSKKGEQRLVCAPSSSRDIDEQLGQRNLKNLNKAGSHSKPKEGGCTEHVRVGGKPAALAAAAETENQPQYVSIASSLLDGRTSPLLDRIEEERSRRKRQYHNMTNVCSASLQQQPQGKVKKEEELVDQLIQDLNEVNDIPFFDIELPYEIALKIFQYLNCAELGRCAQVSRAWRVLAEDSVLWFKLCVRDGYHQNASMSDSPCWKSMLRDCRNSSKTVRFNWKNRVGSISQLQFELGKVLCDVSSYDNFVLAGYTSGDVRLWDTLHWDSTSNVCLKFQIHIYSLEMRKPTVSVGNSPGDFTCINLRDSSPHLLVCGNKDRRVRVFDLRSGSSVASLYAHHLGVTSVQADDWKIVSGGGEGLVCVWEMRMGAKLWEMHNRHPVRHVRFNTSTLVTANIPDDKSPRGACITDDDLTAHRRHRGVICHYDFSEDALSQDHILPICRSDYIESSGYNYNISLAVPYDRLSGSHPSQ